MTSDSADAFSAPDMSTDQFIGERVHQVMWRAKIKQTQIAPQMSLSQSALSRKILGKRSWSIDELAQISTILGVPVEDLVPAHIAAILARNDDVDGGSRINRGYVEWPGLRVA